MKKASESISHKVVSKDSKQRSSRTLMDSRKNLPYRKSERQLKFRVLDSGVKENTICSMCGKKEPDEEGDDEEFDGKNEAGGTAKNARDGSTRTAWLKWASEEWVKKYSAFTVSLNNKIHQL